MEMLRVTSQKYNIFVSFSQISRYARLRWGVSRSFSRSHSQKTLPLNFNFKDTEKIFKTLKTSEIVRALVILSICSFDTVADNSDKLMSLGKKLLGKQLFETLMKKTFYSQFVAGQSIKEVQTVREKLLQAGISTILLVPIETDDPESSITDFEECERIHEKNLETALNAIKYTGKGEFTELRMTPFCSPHVLRILTEKLAPFKETVNKPEHYTLNSFARGMEENFEGIILPDLDDQTNELLRRSLKRFDQMCKCAESIGVKLLFDSEHTYLQAGINHVIMTMQFKYNRIKPLVYNTYQAYLKDTAGRLDADLKLLDESGTLFGAKIVRGAYMELEKGRAARLGYEDPIHPSAEATHRNYDNCVQKVMKSVVKGKANFMLATHNHASILNAINSMNEHNINPSDGVVTFAQTYGMSDQVSFALGEAGYVTYKAVPYGSIDETLLFLARRARENKTVIVGSRKDKPILRRELFRRIRSLQL